MKHLLQEYVAFQFQGRRAVLEHALHAKPERGMFAVANGFGGPTAGTVASEKAVHSIARFLEREAGDLDATLPFVMKSYLSLGANVMFNAMVHANRDLISWNQERKINLRGGSSVVAAFLEGGFLSIGVVGTSQAYLFRHHQIQCLILPHTYERSVRGDGAPIQNNGSCIPLRALGVASEIEPEMLDLKVFSGDQVLLTSRPMTSHMQQQLAQLQPRTGEGIRAWIQPQEFEESMSGIWMRF